MARFDRATEYSTPAGSYTPFRMELMHYSREWDNAGMPHAIFFTQRGHSIHGSEHPWPWHRSISWLCSLSQTFKRSHSLPTRQVGRHGENKGLSSVDVTSRRYTPNHAAETAWFAFSANFPFLMAVHSENQTPMRCQGMTVSGRMIATALPISGKCR